MKRHVPAHRPGEIVTAKLNSFTHAAISKKSTWMVVDTNVTILSCCRGDYPVRSGGITSQFGEHKSQFEERC